MADLGSSMPTSGGLYWWTHYFASPKTRNALSFLVGYSNTLGIQLALRITPLGSVNISRPRWRPLLHRLWLRAHVRFCNRHIPRRRMGAQQRHCLRRFHVLRALPRRARIHHFQGYGETANRVRSSQLRPYHINHYRAAHWAILPEE